MPEEELDPLRNLAADEKLAKKILDIAVTKYEQYKADRGDLEDLWNEIDYMWKCAANDTERTAKTTRNDLDSDDDASDTMADTGSTLGYRAITRLATQTISVLQGRPEPFRYVPIYSAMSDAKQDEGDTMAKQYTDLARWTMDQDNFRVRFNEAIYGLVKYGNSFPCIYWRSKTGKRLVRENGKIRFQDFMVESWPSVNFTPIQNVYLDRHIGNIQRQSCIVVADQVPYADLFCGKRDGYYENVDKVTDAQLYAGEQDQDAHAVRQQNQGLNAGDDTHTDLYDLHDVFIMAPINEAGVWDDKANEPVKFWCTFAGKLDGSAVCLRIQRNPDPDDEWPFIDWHALMDDGDSAYHVAPIELIRSAYHELTTAKNQACDNRTLQNRKPLKVIRGECYNEDLTFGKDKVFYVERQESIGEFQVSDITGTIMQNIDYLENDSARCLSIDAPIEGIAMGQRTSASEAVNVFQQARMPHLVSADYQLTQFLRPYGKKCMRLWQLRAPEQQVVEITTEKPHKQIVPSELFGDYEVSVDIVDDVASDQIRLGALNQGLQYILPNPMFQQSIDPEAFLKDWAELNKWRNPKWIRRKSDFDASHVARLENEVMVFNANPQYDEPKQDENHDMHLREHKAVALQFENLPPEEQAKYPGLSFLKQHIATHEFMQQNSQGGGMVPMQAPSGNETPGEVVGNEMAGQIGAQFNGRPPMQESMPQ